MIVKETVYTKNTERKEIRKCIPTMIQLTPTGYWRHTTDAWEDGLDEMESQLLAEFLGHSDFNKLVGEKYIEIL